MANKFTAAERTSCIRKLLDQGYQPRWYTLINNIKLSQSSRKDSDYSSRWGVPTFWLGREKKYCKMIYNCVFWPHFILEWPKNTQKSLIRPSWAHFSYFYLLLTFFAILAHFWIFLAIFFLKKASDERVGGVPLSYWPISNYDCLIDWDNINWLVTMFKNKILLLITYILEGLSGTMSFHVGHTMCKCFPKMRALAIDIFVSLHVAVIDVMHQGVSSAKSAERNLNTVNT
jgi:hypothetical protein